MKIKLTFLFLLFIGSNLFAQKDWNTLEQDNYAISYPRDWQSSNQKSEPSIEVLLLSDEKSQKEDQFRKSINLKLENLRGQEVRLETYTKISLNQIRAQMPGAEVISNDPIKINNLDARAVIWSAESNNGTVLKFKRTFLIHNDRAYIITFSSIEAEYEEYIEIADRIMNTFNLAK